MLLQVGDTIGFWTLLSYKQGTHEKKGLWTARCNCGNLSKITGDNLKRQKSTKCTNCGQMAAPAEAGIKAIYRAYKYGAKKRGLSFRLSLESFKVIAEQPCIYCGREKLNNSYRKYKNGTLRGAENARWQYTGIDRFDNKKGYIKSNCVPCCKTCNYAKRDMTVTDWYQYLKAIMKQQQKKDLLV